MKVPCREDQKTEKEMDYRKFLKQNAEQNLPGTHRRKTPLQNDTIWQEQDVELDLT
jgi:hypothetical protein